MRSPIRKPDKNVLRKLTQRELSRKGNRSFDRSSAQEKFRGFELCVRTLYLLYLWAWEVASGVLKPLHLCLRALTFLASLSSPSLLLILQNGTLDTHDPKASHLRLSFLKKRSKITEIVAAKVAEAHQFSHQTRHWLDELCRTSSLRLPPLACVLHSAVAQRVFYF